MSCANTYVNKTKNLSGAAILKPLKVGDRNCKKNVPALNENTVTFGT